MSKTSITLTESDYSYPLWITSESQPEVKPTVCIQTDEIIHAAQHGVTWEQLEAYYTVDVNTLKKHFIIEYSKAQATLQINVLDSMVKEAIKGNPVMLKWLSQNWLGMTEKVTPITIDDSKSIDEQQINNRLTALLKKHIKPDSTQT